MIHLVVPLGYCIPARSINSNQSYSSFHPFVMKLFAKDSDITSKRCKKRTVILLADHVDDRMSLSFSVPASYRHKMAAVKAVKAPITTPDISDVQDDTIGDWEAFDTETFSTERLKQRLEKELAIDDNADDDWEEDSAAMLPDDFPILVVNSARFCREVQKEPDEDEISSERQVDKEDEIRFQIQSVIKYHPEEVLESLFDQGRKARDG